MKRFPRSLLTGMTLVCLMAATGLAAQPPGPVARPGLNAFRAGAQPGEFTFDTGVLRGVLRPEGRSLGLMSVVHIPSGKRLDASNGLFSHYRVFTKGMRYGAGAWDWPSAAQLREDGAVEVVWAPAEGRPFELAARYRWHNASTLDLSTMVRPKVLLRGFEVFLASYFDAAFTNSLVFVAQSPEAGGPPGFMAARPELGDWLMAPRDERAVQVIQDGRWKLEPHPVNWVLLPALDRALAVRRDPVSRLTAVLLGQPESCFAIATPHQGEGHYSMYLSLFGRDLEAGTEAEARTRLAMVESPTDQQVIELHDRFLKSADR